MPIENPTIGKSSAASPAIIHNPTIILNPTIERPAADNTASDDTASNDTASDDDSLPKILTPAEARPLRKLESGARSQEPEDREQKTGDKGPGPKLLEARPLDLNSPLTAHPSPLTSSPGDGLAPVPSPVSWKFLGMVLCVGLLLPLGLAALRSYNRRILSKQPAILQ